MSEAKGCTDPEALPAVQISGLTKRYRAVPVLRGIDLVIPAGSAVAVFGPNGAGKSTLLGAIATLVRPSSGTVSVFGHDCVTEGSSARTSIGMLSHSPWLYANMSARDNLHFYARLAGKRVADSAIQKSLADVGLEDVAHADVATMSRGMKQRLGIARAFIGNPRLLLLDEPFTGLDRRSASLLRERLRAFRSEGGTLLVVSHALEEGWSVADRAVVFSRGEVVRDIPVLPDGLPAFEEWYDRHTLGEDR